MERMQRILEVLYVETSGLTTYLFNMCGYCKSGSEGRKHHNCRVQVNVFQVGNTNCDIQRALAICRVVLSGM